MRKIILGIFLSLIGSALLQAQVSGTFSIPGVTYPTVASAIAAINSTGIGSGGVTFNVAAGYTETFSSLTAGLITATGTASNPIVFKKSGSGADPVISSSAGTAADYEYIFCLQGSDYVTFDGIDVTDLGGFIEGGYDLMKASVTDGCQYITIKNCTITLNKADLNVAVGINSNLYIPPAMGTAIAITAASGSNSNLKIYSNTFTNCYNSIYLVGYNDANAPYVLYDQNNEIGKDGANIITNVGGSAKMAYGIYTIYQNNLKVANNTVNSAMVGANYHYGIFLTTAKNGSYDLYSNSVSLQFSGAGSTYLYPIYCDMGGSGTSNTINVYNNVVSGCTFPTMTSGNLYYMQLVNNAVATNVYANTISSNTAGSSGTATTGRINYLMVSMSTSIPSTVSIHDNNVTGNTRLQSSPLGGGTYFIATGGNGALLNLYNNNINNNIVASNGGTYGIYASFDIGAKNVYNNTVTNISKAEGTFYGLYNYAVTANSGTNNIYKNKVNNIEGLTAGSNMYGIYSTTSGSIPVYYYNNMISDLRTPAGASASSAYNSINGIYISSGSYPVGVYYNTVYLNASSTATNFGTTAFYTQTSSIVDLRNNILVNNSTPSGLGKTVAVRFSSSSYINFSPLSNYNDLYAGIPGASNLIFSDGIFNDQTLVAYKIRFSPRELESVTELPSFVNVATRPYDVHLKNNVATQCESSGTVVSTPISIVSDFDGDARYPNTGYPVNALYPPLAPDMGADEIGGIPYDITPPSIVYTPLQNTYNGNPRTLTASITDGSGVPQTGLGLPVLYWRINAGAYQAAQGTYVSGNTYSFSFGTGAAIGNTVTYYIAAQDMAATPNAGSYPWIDASGFSTFPPACSSAPSSPYSYKIIADVSGILHVGVGKDYNSLTAAATDINAKYISGPLTLLLDDPTYPSEVFPIMFIQNAGSSPTNTLTIRPNPGNSATFAASIASGNGLLQLNGIDYMIIDGSNNGTNSKNLTFQNTSTSTGAYGINVLNNAGDPTTNVTIKNCIIKCTPVNSSVVSIVDIMFSGTGGGYDNFIIDNNILSSAFDAIQLYGTAANITHNCQITNNTIGSTLDAEAISHIGVYMTYVDNTLISGNEIMGPFSGSLNTGQTGVNMGAGSTNTKIRKNSIHSFYHNADDGWGATGIWFASDATSVTEISNNLIYDIKAPGINPGVGQNITYGIFCRSGGNVKVLHNTIYLSGPYLSGYYDASSACIGLYYQATGGNFEIRDNVLKNSMTETGSGHVSGKAYGIMISTAASVTFSTINNNDYYIDGYNGSIAQLYQNGMGIMGEYPTLASWQTYTGQEANSLNVDPVFTSATNLKPTTAAMPHAGAYITAIPTDFTGTNRTNPPDMGAYEFTASPLITTLAASSVTYNSATLMGNANAIGTTFSLYFDWGTSSSYGTSIVASPAVATGSSVTPMNTGLTGLTPLTTYHYRARGITSGGLIVFGNDITFTTAPAPPAVITVAANPIASSGATLNGTVNSNGGSSIVTFQYGLTTSYGSTITAVQSPVTGAIVTNVNASITGLTPYTTYHFRVLATNAGGTTYGSDLSFTTSPILASVITSLASSVGASSATINGSVNPNYAPTTVTFEWGLNTLYGNTVTANPNLVTGSNSIQVLANLSGLAWVTTYHYRCVGNNAAGTSYGSDLTFQTGCAVPVAPGSITGPSSVCQNQSGVTYSVPPITNASNYNWTVPAGATIISGTGTSSIVVNFSPTASSGNITVTGTNFCATGTTGTLAVTVNTMPVPTIAGSPGTCIQSANNVYTTQTGMSSYNWTVSAGGTITAGSGTSAITVTWGTTGTKTVTVNYANANGCSALVPGSYTVTVNPLPSPAITGTSTMCANSGYYTYTTEPGMTGYTWAVSSGGSIYAGANTNIVTITWNSAGAQTVSVNYNNANGCQAASPTVMNVTVTDIPAAAGAITGNSSVCAGAQGVAYSVAPVTGALAYVWNLPSGASIASGSGTNSITVNYSSSAVSGPITVTGNNLCGNGTSSPALNVTVSAIPSAAGTISGPASVCTSETGVGYTVPPVTSATSYTWTVPSGATITSGATTNSITVDFGPVATSGNVTVYGSNSCGNGASSSLIISVNPIPVTPTITASGYVLTSSAPAGNQWYHDGTAVSGATSQTYTVPSSAPGWYWTMVTLSGCSSDTSNHKYIQGVGIGEHTSDNVNIYPVPNDGLFNIAINSEKEISYKLEIYNNLGVKIYGGHTINVIGKTVTEVDLGTVAAGLYTVVLRSSDNQLIRKILINK
ncbi:MAG: right-handed parallel beta-helix repeat-containing protein [Bacteroidetes bacterium]|nr:right-handed parallel beta-helix repeat-containing protein [Bacteroidota bacterium]